MSNIGIITINNGRPQIFHLWCESIKRLRKELQIEIPVIVVSGQEDKEMCNQYGIAHITQNNIPVTEKWNTSAQYMLDVGVEYILILGSDDIMSTECFKNIMIETNKDVDLIGLKKIYIYATDGEMRGHLRCLTSKSFLGVGKTIGRRVFDALNSKPWGNCVPRNFGTDAVLHRNISPHIQTVAEVEGVVVDCKSKESLNKYTMFQGRHGQECNKDIFYNILSKEELQILNSIRDTGLPVGFPRVHKRGRTLI